MSRGLSVSVCWRWSCDGWRRRVASVRVLELELYASRVAGGRVFWWWMCDGRRVAISHHSSSVAVHCMHPNCGAARGHSQSAATGISDRKRLSLAETRCTGRVIVI